MVVDHKIPQSEFMPELAKLFLQYLKENADGERKLVFLGGGNSPKALHKCLLETADNSAMKNYLFVPSDERVVSPDDDLCNGKMIEETLIRPFQMEENFRPFNLENFRDPGQCLQDNKVLFERELQAPIALSFLGVGPDGHTASLFPGINFSENESQVIDGGKGPEGAFRLSFSLGTFLQSKEIWLLANSEEKLHVLRQAQSGAFDESPLRAIFSSGKLVRVFQVE